MTSYFFLPQKIDLISKYLCARPGSDSFKDKRVTAEGVENTPRVSSRPKSPGFKEVPLFAILTRNISSDFSLEFFSVCQYNS